MSYLFRNIHVILVCAALFVCTFSDAQAHTSLPIASRLPDQPTYILQSLQEITKTAFTRNKLYKAQLQQQFAERRLAEAEGLIEQGKRRYLLRLSQQYDRLLYRSYQTVQKVPADQQSDPLEMIAGTALSRQTVLADIYEHAVTQEKPGIETVMKHTMDLFETIYTEYPTDKKESLDAHLFSHYTREEFNELFDIQRAKNIPIPPLPEL